MVALKSALHRLVRSTTVRIFPKMKLHSRSMVLAHQQSLYPHFLPNTNDEDSCFCYSALCHRLRSLRRKDCHTDSS